MIVPWEVTSQEAGSLPDILTHYAPPRSAPSSIALENPIETDSGHREAASYHSGQQPILQ
jgi:hypothetical protein